MKFKKLLNGFTNLLLNTREFPGRQPKVVKATDNEAFLLSKGPTSSTISLYTFVCFHSMSVILCQIQLSGYNQLNCQVHQALSCLPGRPCMSRQCSVALLRLLMGLPTLASQQKELLARALLKWLKRMVLVLLLEQQSLSSHVQMQEPENQTTEKANISKSRHGHKHLNIMKISNFSFKQSERKKVNTWSIKCSTKQQMYTYKPTKYIIISVA